MIYSVFVGESFIEKAKILQETLLLFKLYLGHPSLLNLRFWRQLQIQLTFNLSVLGTFFNCRLLAKKLFLRRLSLFKEEVPPSKWVILLDIDNIRVIQQHRVIMTIALFILFFDLRRVFNIFV